MGQIECVFGYCPITAFRGTLVGLAVDKALYEVSEPEVFAGGQNVIVKRIVLLIASKVIIANARPSKFVAGRLGGLGEEVTSLSKEED